MVDLALPGKTSFVTVTLDVWNPDSETIYRVATESSGFVDLILMNSLDDSSERRRALWGLLERLL